MPVATQSLREIVTAAPFAAAVLERFDIDLCSRADTQLEQVCAELRLSVDQVLEKLSDAESKASGATAPDFKNLSLTQLIRHIVRTHHQYVRQELPRLVELSRKIADVEKVPQYTAVATLIEQLHTDLFSHLGKEEEILFPYVVRLEEAAEDRSSAPHAFFQSVAHPVSVMIAEHDSAGEILDRMRHLTNGFDPPAWACPRSIAFHAGLAAFAGNLQQHVLLENGLLFPRAIALEARVWQRRQS